MSNAPIRLSDISRCFQGVIPSIIATSDAVGTPNVTYVSQVFLIDDGHVALSCQFFNKTRRNLDQNPRASAEIYDPITFDAYRLRLRFLRSEKSGPLFNTMAMRIDAIASHTGMAGVFRLLAADVFEVVRIERVAGFLAERPETQAGAVTLDGYRTELRGLQWISDHINRAGDLESLLDAVLEALETFFGFANTMVLLAEEDSGRLVTMASRGYGESGVGAEVAIGEGLIGTVAKERKLLRMAGLDGSLRYGRAIRRETMKSAQEVRPEIPLPGLVDAQSVLVIPLTVGNRLIGVVSAESRDPMAFSDWHEAYLEVVANQIALGIDRMIDRDEEEERDAAPVVAQHVVQAAPPETARRKVVYYRNDDCIFVDDEYLVRNVPGRILWKLLGEWQQRGRTEFSNRELRLDESLGLPEVKDNLESRLILLRHRLQEKCPDLRMVSTGRGKFALEVNANLELVER